MKIVGLKPYSFTTKDTGKLIEGVTVHCTFADENIHGGTGVEKFSITKENLQGTDLELGMEVEPLYSKYNKVSFVRILSANKPSY